MNVDTTFAQLLAIQLVFESVLHGQKSTVDVRLFLLGREILEAGSSATRVISIIVILVLLRLLHNLVLLFQHFSRHMYLLLVSQSLIT